MYTTDDGTPGLISHLPQHRWAPHEDLAQAQALVCTMQAHGWNWAEAWQPAHGTVMLHKHGQLCEDWGTASADGCSHPMAIVRCVAQAAVQESRVRATPHQQHIHQNDAAFLAYLPALLKTQRGLFALLHAETVVACFTTAREAWLMGQRLVPDGRFSVRQITDTPVALGFFAQDKWSR